MNIRKTTSRLIAIFLTLVFVCTAFASCAPKQKVDIKYDKFEELSILDSLFRAYSLFDLDEEALMNAVLKGYIEGTGDRYAEYFTHDEYERFFSDNRGETVGIGVSVIQNTDENCIEIINVVPNSPALEAGVLPGDLIVFIGKGEEQQDVRKIGYTNALELLRGVEGSTADFTVLRKSKDKEETIEFSVQRRKVKSVSVLSHVCEFDDKIGIVKITEFNITTPKQFTEAVDSLLGRGCEKFIFDVRYNPGGDLKSIKAVLSCFLDNGDVFIRVAGKDGKMSKSKIREEIYEDSYADCSVKKDEIGKYKDLKFAVLTNGNTASAAELFTSALMDYKLSLTVGTKTYGKGTMQSTFLLAQYGIDGAMKLTTKYYYPPISDSYDGKGITPDVEVELSEDLVGRNIYTIKDSEDNQLKKAVEELYKRDK